MGFKNLEWKEKAQTGNNAKGKTENKEKQGHYILG